jgi:hypothetical protein
MGTTVSGQEADNESQYSFSLRQSCEAPEFPLAVSAGEKPII